MGVGAIFSGILAATGSSVVQSLHSANKARKKAARTLDIEKGEGVATDEAIDTVKEQKKNIKKRRVNLFQTEGGVSGEELQPGQISQRKTLLGN